MSGTFASPVGGFQTQVTHPLITNAQEFLYCKKYVSIHSEDRDIVKFPDSAEFEIELPEDICNVATVQLYDWTFPANYNTFSPQHSNVTMTFSIPTPYNPTDISGGSVDELSANIYYALTAFNQGQVLGGEFRVVIEEGYYTPQQMVIELTRKFNYVVNQYLASFFATQATNPALTQAQRDSYQQSYTQITATTDSGYNRFLIVYHPVNQKIWFGNVADQFCLRNETIAKESAQSEGVYCGSGRAQLPDYSNWGLPSNVGLTRTDNLATNLPSTAGSPSIGTYLDTGIWVPRFYYGDITPGDDGYWLVPDASLPGSTVFWVESSYKINLMGPAYMYLEIDKMNCIDETSPFSNSTFAQRTNGTTGIVNSSFAKIAIPTTPITQWFDKQSLPYKWFNPPAERVRRMRFRIRYHNGQLVNFGVFNYTFTLEFTLQMPQILQHVKKASFTPIDAHQPIMSVGINR